MLGVCKVGQLNECHYVSMGCERSVSNIKRFAEAPGMLSAEGYSRFKNDCAGVRRSV